jgi:hypothetical protein
VDVYSLSHLADATLSRDLDSSVAQECAPLALQLARIGEFDARRLYLPAACPSMHEFCVRRLHMSEDSAYKRIRAARTARKFPVLFAAVAEGRLHLSAVVLLAPHLTDENAADLIAAATHKSKSEIEHLLARRSTRPAAAPRGEITPTAMSDRLAPGPVLFAPTQLAPGPIGPAPSQLATERVELPRGRVTPLSAERYGFTFTGGQEFHEL